tara:strand:+ start:284 stop:553 length:270 start_codon:yes stop_codon:yes gene_type:complete
MQPRTFKNFQPNDAIRNKKGEVFEIIERITRFCKGCSCKPSNPCDTFKENTTLVIKSQRGIWQMTLKEINTKFVNNEIDEVTYKNGQWN